MKFKIIAVAHKGKVRRVIEKEDVTTIKSKPIKLNNEEFDIDLKGLTVEEKMVKLQQLRADRAIENYNKLFNYKKPNRNE